MTIKTAITLSALLFVPTPADSKSPESMVIADRTAEFLDQTEIKDPSELTKHLIDSLMNERLIGRPDQAIVAAVEGTVALRTGLDLGNDEAFEHVQRTTSSVISSLLAQHQNEQTDTPEKSRDELICEEVRAEWLVAFNGTFLPHLEQYISCITHVFRRQLPASNHCDVYESRYRRFLEGLSVFKDDLLWCSEKGY